jgi:NAD(P)H-flavin reductase
MIDRDLALTQCAPLALLVGKRSMGSKFERLPLQSLFCYYNCLMSTFTAQVIEIRMEAGQRLSGIISVSVPVRIEPGQYLLAQAVNQPETLPLPVFHCGAEGRQLHLAAPLPETWQVGTLIALRGPLGSGFHLPPGARKVALAALDGGPQRLITLVDRTLQQGGDVALYCSMDVPAALPLAVEVLPLNQLPQALTWADYMALDVPVEMLPDLPDHLGLKERMRCPCPTEALVVAQMPCGGVAECGVCAVHTQQGWRLACKDGPVFDVDTLLER